MTERRGDPTEPALKPKVDGGGYAIVLVLACVIFLLIGACIGFAIAVLL